MITDTFTLRSGYDKKTCIVQARCCYAPWGIIATAQKLDVSGSDLYSGIMMSISNDGGKSWSGFANQDGLKPIISDDGKTIVGCDGTPMYHKKTDTVLLIGQTAAYLPDSLSPIGGDRSTFFSTLRKDGNTFSKMKFIKMPGGFENCGSGCCQAVEKGNGDLLIPVYYKLKNSDFFASAVMLCSFDGENLEFKNIGTGLELSQGRGLYEPSLIKFGDTYYITLRNDDYGYVAKSKDGLNFTDLQKWRWNDERILPTYNTQQHWMLAGGKLYLVYTRRGAGNDHVFRHRAPLFAAEVENMKLKKESEFIVVKERGARLGNFGVTQISDRKAAVMAAEWMQPAGCEAYGSNNSIFLTVIE